ncbi:MAG: signal peptidase I [Hyphomicrobiaceae bacterium]
MTKSSDPPVKSTAAELWDITKVVLQALALAIFVRIFLYQPFNIPSGSMENTLLVGDYLFVSKFSYGYSKYSFPFDAIPFSGRIWSGEPERGDIAVFRKPTNLEEDFIKRVIGLPGDKVQMKDGQLYINGEAVPKVRVEDYDEPDRYGNDRKIPRFEETLPNGVKYFVLDRWPDSEGDNTSEFTVPAGHYFMMGDNRDNSSDSRFQGPDKVGFVPLENFIGRAQIIFYSTDGTAGWLEPWRWPVATRWSRIGQLTR